MRAFVLYYIMFSIYPDVGIELKRRPIFSDVKEG